MGTVELCCDLCIIILSFSGPAQGRKSSLAGHGSSSSSGHTSPSESPARSLAGGSSCGEGERSLTTPPLPPALKHNPNTTADRKDQSVYRGQRSMSLGGPAHESLMSQLAARQSSTTIDLSPGEKNKVCLVCDDMRFLLDQKLLTAHPDTMLGRMFAMRDSRGAGADMVTPNERNEFVVSDALLPCVFVVPKLFWHFERWTSIAAIFCRVAGVEFLGYRNPPEDHVRRGSNGEEEVVDCI
ncbi:unnamed protein product [Nippostrongylus brasiliensis]|uniref:BTBD10/KCTD20 BTB/POZ domain-containing protein n=1 Tax=Nippostrongylus brasiliensis TaxID=27835 RepID=A0A3P7BKZ6_NIPBR|nr:unnamed protein product [Nippostrongylus brasiliensis]